MNIGVDLIEQVEKEYDMVALSRIRKDKQYYYVKIVKRFPEIVQNMSIKTRSGKYVIVPFVSVSDYERIKQEDGRKKRGEIKKRAYLGRPYKFCKGCDKIYECSNDVVCPLREQYLKEKEDLDRRKLDDRFWNNGSPKKHLMLCESARYRQAHKATAGQCQKEKCRFYSENGCELGIKK